MCVCVCVQAGMRAVPSDSAMPRTVAHQAPLPMGFSRQEYFSVLPCPLPGDLPDPGIQHPSVTSPTLAGGFLTTSPTWEALNSVHLSIKWQ